MWSTLNSNYIRLLTIYIDRSSGLGNFFVYHNICFFIYYQYEKHKINNNCNKNIYPTESELGKPPFSRQSTLEYLPQSMLSFYSLYYFYVHVIASCIYVPLATSLNCQLHINKSINMQHV